MKFILNCSENVSLLRSTIDFASVQLGSRNLTVRKEVAEWLDANITAWKCNGVIILPGENNEGIEFEFLNESEFVAFKLRWT